MNQNIILLVIAILFAQATSHVIQIHQKYTDNCFYLPMGEIKKNPAFNYTIIKAWNQDEAAKIKNGTLNIADYVVINGWTPYDKPNLFL